MGVKIIATVSFNCPFCGKKHENKKIAIGTENALYFVGYKGKGFKCQECKAEFFFDYMSFATQISSFHFNHPERYRDVMTIDTSLAIGRFLVAMKD